MIAGLSSFIYQIPDWEKLNEEIALRIASENLNQIEYFQYCINRWYNFWSARAVEQTFTAMPGIIPAKNPRNKKVDFNFYGIDFDLKTSVFPKRYPGTYESARRNKENLIRWLYQNQSRQGRFHLENRLFLMVYADDGQHWKLKAEISRLRAVIENYVANFEVSQLKKLEFQNGKSAFSDLIWATK